MFANRRLARLARKIEELGREKRAHLNDFQTFNANENVEKCVEAWQHLTAVCRKLSKYRKAERRLKVKETP